MDYLTNIGKNIQNTAHYFSEIDILCHPSKQDLLIKINYVYNQVERLDKRIVEMVLSDNLNPADMKWININKQRDDRRNELDRLLVAYSKV